MRSVSEHRHAVQAALAPLHALAPQLVGVGDALGRVLTADVHAPVDLPVFRNSAMDGYALAAGSAAPGTPLPVVGTIAAGDGVDAALPPGSAVKIMTGAVLPDGADAVVPVERTVAGDGTVTLQASCAPGDFIREPGSDVRSGAVLARAGTVLAPRHIAALAAVGLVSVPVRRRPRVAVLTTGSELVPAGTALGPGQIFDSNGTALAACAKADGAEIVSIDHSSDDSEIFLRKLAAAADAADVVCTSGGVSMGEFEVVRATLGPRGGDFGHVAMQPGGPQGLTVLGGVPVLSFPGNPVSTVVSYLVFARPQLRAAGGLPPIAPRTLRLDHPITSIRGKRQFLRAQRTERGVTVSPPGSHLVAAMAWADVLVEVPEDCTELPAGADVTVWEL